MNKLELKEGVKGLRSTETGTFEYNGHKYLVKTIKAFLSASTKLEVIIRQDKDGILRISWGTGNVTVYPQKTEKKDPTPEEIIKLDKKRQSRKDKRNAELDRLTNEYYESKKAV